MSDRPNNITLGGPAPGIDRRTLLASSAAGGAALAASLFSTVAGAEAALQQSATPAAQAARMRRIVTAHNAEGKSYIASDEMVAVGNLWTTGPDKVLGDAAAGEKLQVSRLTGETRHFVAAIQPSRDPKPNLTNRLGFHRTNGIAYCYILNGELFFLVDTQEVKIGAGDLVVERNTMHSWRNEGTAPVSMLITVVNAGA